jgi:hypothetical protein
MSGVISILHVFLSLSRLPSLFATLCWASWFYEFKWQLWIDLFVCIDILQSSGKSSVLESIVGRDFLPRGSGDKSILYTVALWTELTVLT